MKLTGFVKRFPWFTFFLCCLGANFGVIDFIKNNDVLYAAMLASGMEPTVPATYWVFGGWKVGLLNTVVFLSLPFVLTMLIAFSAVFNVKPRNIKEAGMVFLGAASVFSGSWDLVFLGLTLQYWGGELLGGEIMWLPIAWSPDTGVVGISFSMVFGAWFIFFRLLFGLLLLTYYEYRAIRRRIK